MLFITAKIYLYFSDSFIMVIINSPAIQSLLHLTTVVSIFMFLSYNPCAGTAEQYIWISGSLRTDSSSGRDFFSHLIEDGFDVDGQVSVRAAEPPYDAEAQARRASLQSDGLVCASTVGTDAEQCVAGDYASVGASAWKSLRSETGCDLCDLISPG